MNGCKEEILFKLALKTNYQYQLERGLVHEEVQSYVSYLEMKLTTRQ